MAVQRVAVLTPGDPLGDGLMRLPLLHGIRRRWPEHRVWWVAGGTTVMNGALAAYSKPHLERIVTDFKIERPVRDVALAARDLPAFEIVFCIYSRMANVLAVKRVLKPAQFYACLALQIGSTHRDPQWLVRRPAHMKARIRSIARAAGCEIPPIRDILPISDAARQAAARIVRTDKPHVGLVIGTANYQVHKAWPLARFIALGNRLLARGEQPVFLIGPTEAALVDQIRAGAPQAILARLDRFDGRFRRIGRRRLSRPRRETCRCGRDGHRSRSYACGGRHADRLAVWSNATGKMGARSRTSHRRSGSNLRFRSHGSHTA